jgi:hypothetical protein
VQYAQGSEGEGNDQLHKVVTFQTARRGALNAGNEDEDPAWITQRAPRGPVPRPTHTFHGKLLELVVLLERVQLTTLLRLRHLL